MGIKAIKYLKLNRTQVLLKRQRPSNHSSVVDARSLRCGVVDRLEDLVGNAYLACETNAYDRAMGSSNRTLPPLFLSSLADWNLT